MRFFFDPHKATAAAAYLVGLHGGTMNIMSLIKLLYLADRKSLLETGLPITGDWMVSMPRGPVLSRIYEAVNFGRITESMEDDPWSSSFSERKNHEIALTVDSPSTEELSRYEMELLEKIHKDYGGMTQWDLSKLTHKLPEWENPHGSSLPIDPEFILRAEGRSDHEIREIVQEAEEVYFLSTLNTPSAVLQ